MRNLTDPSFKGVIYTCDLEHELNTLFLNAPNLKAFILNSITKSYYAVGFSYPNLWNERFQEIVEGLITGGIINQYLKKYKDYSRKSKVEDLESDKVILNLSHLGFGFQICFFVIYSALVVFLIELLVFWGRTHFRNKKVNDIQPMQAIFIGSDVETPKKHQDDQINNSSEQNNIIISDLEIYDDSFGSDTKVLDKAFGEDLSKINKIEILLSDIETLYEQRRLLE